MNFLGRSGLHAAAVAMICYLLAGLTPASAADTAATSAAPAAGDDSNEAREVDTENIFGFTEGADVNERGERELSITLFGAFGRLGALPEGDDEGGDDDEEAEIVDTFSSHYSVWEGEAEFEYGVTDALTLGVGASASHHDIENTFGLEDENGSGFNGLSGQVKYRFLDRETAPFGMSVSIEPEWSRFEDNSGERADGLELPIRLMIDREIIPERLFGAFNATYASEWTEGEDETEKESALELSGALAWQAIPGMFIGGELRYLASFEGIGLSESEGNALYLGPSFFTQIADGAYFKVAYAYQVAGSSPENEDSLDLVGHERQQLQVKLGVEF